MDRTSGWETESVLLFIMSPLLGVLAEVIGCAMLASHGGYSPSYIAARQGAIGGPIATIVSIFISAALTEDEELLTDEEYYLAIEAGLREDNPWQRRIDLQVDRTRRWWSYVAPYAICVGGPPIGSAIMHATKLSQAIDALHAVRAGALGGIFAVPIYFTFIMAWLALVRWWS